MIFFLVLLAPKVVIRYGKIVKLSALSCSCLALYINRFWIRFNMSAREWKKKCIHRIENCHRMDFSICASFCHCSRSSIWLPFWMWCRVQHSASLCKYIYTYMYVYIIIPYTYVCEVPILYVWWCTCSSSMYITYKSICKHAYGSIEWDQRLSRRRIHLWMPYALRVPFASRRRRFYIVGSM